MGVTRPLLAVAGIILVSGGCAPDHLTAPAAQPQDSRAAMGQWAGMQNAPLFVVNGRTVQPAAARHLDPNTIAGVTVLKGARAVEQFGPSAENGVVVIPMIEGAETLFSR